MAEEKEKEIVLSDRATFIGTGKIADYEKGSEYIIGVTLGLKFVKAGYVTKGIEAKETEASPLKA